MADNSNGLDHLSPQQIYSVLNSVVFCCLLNSYQLFVLKLTHEVIDDICGITRLQTHKYVPKLWSTEDKFNKFVEYFKILLSNLIDIRNKHEVCIHVFHLIFV